MPSTSNLAPGSRTRPPTAPQRRPGPRAGQSRPSVGQQLRTIKPSRAHRAGRPGSNAALLLPGFADHNRLTSTHHREERVMEIPQFEGSVLEAGDEGFETARRGLERGHSASAGSYLPLHGDRRRADRRAFRSGAGTANCDPRRRSRSSRTRDVRGRAGDRPVQHDRGAGGPSSRNATGPRGCLWRHVDHESQAFGMAVTGGIVTHTRDRRVDLGRWDRPPHAPLRTHH